MKWRGIRKLCRYDMEYQWRWVWCMRYHVVMSFERIW